MVNTDLIIMKRAIFYTACLAALAAYVLQGTSFCWDAGSFFADCARCLPSSSKHNAVLITGASSGIGKEIALLYAGAGAKLLLTARREELLQQTAKACLAAGAESVDTLALDLSIDKDLELLMLKLHELFGYTGLDYLYLVHAKIPKQFFGEDESLEDVDRSVLHTMRTNYDSCVKIIHVALPLVEKAEGRIVAIGSLGVYFAQAMMSGYLASKAALHTFVETLRVELDLTGREHVTTTWINLGLVLTEQIVGMSNERSSEIDYTELTAISPKWSAQLITCSAERRLYESYVPWHGYWLSWLGVIYKPIRSEFAYHGLIKPRPDFLRRMLNQTVGYSEESK